MIDKKEIFKYLLEQVQADKFDKDYAFSILKQLKEKGVNPDFGEVAIIGIGCRMADTENHYDFWDNLIDQKNNIGDLSPTRREDLAEYFTESQCEPSDFLKGAYLESIDKFDADLFKIPPNVAESMDPYQRIFLEVAVESFMDAGYSIKQVQGSNTGVFVGTDHTHKLTTSFLNLFKATDFSTMTGSWTGILSSRTSYILNLNGPSMVIDTACSSSMSALSVACNSLQNKECSQALVGGLNILFSPFNDKNSVNLEVIESDDVKVRPFDKDAQGAIWGEAVCSILIKPLKQAVKDNDHIYAVIKGCGVNNDGTTNGITAPNPKAQTNLLANTWKKAKINPEHIRYIEAHAIGTILGDSMEVKGLTSAFEQFTNKKQFCGIGSVKSNYGHTVGVSGLLSTIKVALALKHKVLPPTINFENPNPHIDFESTPLYLVDEAKKWVTDGDLARLAGVNSYSFNGTNIHLLLEEFIPKIEPAESDTRPNIFTLSARAPELLANLISRYMLYLNRYDDLNIDQICYTQNCRRDHYPFRLAFVVNSYQELKKKITELSSARNGNSISGVFYSNDTPMPTSEIYRKEDECSILIDKTKAELTSQNLSEICEYYVQNININWDSLYAENSKRKLPIPLTPFKQDRHWPSKKSKSSQIISIVGKDNGELSPIESDVAHIWTEVFGFTELNVKDDLYKLGGDSISAMRIVNLLNEKYDIAVDLSDLLITPVLSDFAGLIERKYISGDSTKSRVKTPDLTRANPVVGNCYVVSSPQQRMFYLWHLSSDSTLYNLSIGAPINKDIDLDKLQNAFDKLVQEHEIMRTSFKSVGDELYQIIQDKVDSSICFENHTTHSIEDLEYVNDLMKKSIRNYSLETAPLFKLYLFKFKDNKSFIYLDIHHIISDGTSLAIFFQQLINYYEGSEMHVSNFQYKDYAAWQQTVMQSGVINKEEEFWLEQFEDEIPVLNLPTDFRRPQVQSFEGDTLRFIFNVSVREQIINLAKNNSTTLNVVMLSIVNILLSKLSNQEDIVIGTPVSGRTNSQVDLVMGMFVNTLALNNKPTGDKTYAEFLNEVKINSLKAYDNQNYQFEDLVDKLSIKRDASRNPLFDVMFQMQNEEFTMPLFECQRNISKFDLTLTVREEGEDLHLDIEFAKALFQKGTIEKFFQYIGLIVSQLSTDQSKKLSEITILNNVEKELILNTFNNTKTDYPAHQNIVQLFKEIVNQYPDKMALYSEDKQYSYQELDIYSNQLAHKIKEYVSPGDHVNLISERSPELVISILAIFKVGAAYVPLDTKYPSERIKSLIKDCQAKLVIVQDKYSDLLPKQIKSIVLTKDAYSDEATSDLPIVNSPLDIAYIMYTSGSTGTPKGVEVEHRNIIRLVRNTNYHNFTSSDNIPLMAAPSFDASTYEIYGTLLNGGTLCVIDEKCILDPIELKVQFDKMNVNFAFFTTALFNQYSERSIEVFSGLSTILIGGEKLSISACNRFYNTYPNIAFYNVYGPTENCTYSTYFRIDKEYNDGIPIGAPISNTTLYILDKGANLLPIGVTGEICLGGDGIAKGYLNSIELTDQKFINNPFGTGKLYCTGDYGKWLPDGNVFFIGRIDNQLKIRGFRIEVDEIEATVLKYNNIVEAAITVEINSSGLKDLSCFYKTKDNISLLGSDLRQFLSEQLPEYMIPSYFTQVDQFILNKNGKIEKALLKTDKEHIIESIIDPENEIETTILEVWKEVLGLENISTDSNFFHIGGDSIKAIQISSRLQAKGIGVSVNTIFQHSSIQDLALNTERHIVNIDQSPVEGLIELTPIQKWFFNLNFQEKDCFNQGVLIKMDKPISLHNLNTAFLKLTEHHDALRIKFDIEKTNVISQYNRKIGEPVFSIEEFDVSNTSNPNTFIDEKIGQIQNDIDISKQLIKVGHFKGNSTSSLCIIIHHLLIDGVSWRILLEDLFQVIELINNQQEIKLPSKTTSFREWSSKLQDYGKYNENKKYASYWNELAYKASSNQSDIWTSEKADCSFSTSSSLRYSLDTNSTQSLLTEVNKAYNTEINDILITALAMSVSDWSKKNKALINLEGHGRENIIDNVDITRTIGWFTSSYPILIETKAKDNLSEIIKSTKDYLHTIPQKGIDYGILKYIGNTNTEKINMLYSINPSISFNYLGQFDLNTSKQTDIDSTIEFLPLAIDGKNKRYFSIDINAIMSGSQLYLDFNYSHEEFDQSNIQELINRYEKNLKNIISHCTSQDDTEYTLSDYTSKDIDNEEFDNILDELGFD